MLKRIIFVTIALVTFGSVFALADGPRGRGILRDATVVKVEGTLRYEDLELKLETESGSYLLHFGNRAYLAQTGIELKEGDALSIEGALSGDDLLVFSTTKGGRTYRFRDERGIPLWSRGETDCSDRFNRWRMYGWKQRRDCEDCPGNFFKTGKGQDRELPGGMRSFREGDRKCQDYENSFDRSSGWNKYWCNDRRG